MGGRIDIAADDSGELLDAPGGVRELEGLHPMRREAVVPPDALHADHTDAGHLGHGVSIGTQKCPLIGVQKGPRLMRIAPALVCAPPPTAAGHRQARSEQ